MEDLPAGPRRRRHPPTLPSVALLLLGCHASAASPAPADPEDTPRELVAHLQQLEEQERYGDVLERITPDQREAYVFISWYGAAFDAIGAEPEVVADYRAIVSAHGLDEEWLKARSAEDASGRDGLRRVAAKAFRNVDLAPLLGDLARFRREHGRFGAAFGFLGELRELHVERAWARARIEDTELELRRVDDAWTWCPFPELGGQTPAARAAGGGPG